MAIAHVQTPAGGVANSSATSVNLAFGSNVTAASCIVGGWRYGTNGRTVTLSDTQTNSYTSNAVSASDPSDGNSTVGVGFALNAAAGATTVTFGISGAAANLRFSTSEFSGVATSSALDKTASANGSGAPTTSSVTPDSDGQLFYGITHSPSGETYVAGTDFTINTTVPTGAGSQRLATERFIQTTAAAHVFSFGDIADTYAIAGVTLRAAGGGGAMVATGSLSITGVADLDAPGSLSAAGALSIAGAADIDGLGAMAAAGLLAIAGAADLDGTGSLSAAGVLAINGSADLNDPDGSDMVAAGSLSITGTADADAFGSLAAAGALAIAGSADLDASGAMAAAGAVSISGAADLTAPTINDLTAVGALSITGLADMDALAALQATGFLSIGGIADLDAPGRMAAVGLLTITGLATINDGLLPSIVTLVSSITGEGSAGDGFVLAGTGRGSLSSGFVVSGIGGSAEPQ